jgi:hypothetical protein
VTLQAEEFNKSVSKVSQGKNPSEFFSLPITAKINDEEKAGSVVVD